MLSLCSFIGIGEALSHQIVTAAAQTSPFQWASLNLFAAEAQRCSQWAGDERCHWRALCSVTLLLSVSTNLFVSLSLSINKFGQYFEGLCLFITPANTRDI